MTPSTWPVPSAGMKMQRGARIIRAGAALVTTLTLSLTGMMVTTGTAHASGVCGPDMRWPGTVGEVTAQLGPTGFVQWGARDYTDNSGLWTAWVMVGSRVVDKKSQLYQPHGSVHPKDLRSGQVLSFTVSHINSHGDKSFSNPDANCVIP